MVEELIDESAMLLCWTKTWFHSVLVNAQPIKPTHPRTRTRTHPLTPIYIYIYIHTHAYIYMRVHTCQEKRVAQRRPP